MTKQGNAGVRDNIRTVALVALSTLSTAATADQGNYPYGPHMWDSGVWMGWFMGPVMMLAMIAIVVAVVVLIYRWLGGPGHGPVYPPSPTGKMPLDILKERYARGEIDKGEFEERRKVLVE